MNVLWNYFASLLLLFALGGPMGCYRQVATLYTEIDVVQIPVFAAVHDVVTDA